MIGRAISLPSHVDQRGIIAWAEGQRDVPFDVKRVFWIVGVPDDQLRGMHAQRRCEEAIFCVAGSAKLQLTSRENLTEEYELTQPNVGVLVPAMTWNVMRGFSRGAVALVLCSDGYAAPITDMQEFLEATNERVRQLF